MAKQKHHRDGGYLRRGFYVRTCRLPSLEMDNKGVLCTIFWPIWFISRIFFWKVHKKLYRGYEIWIPRKIEFPDDDTEKACEYLKALLKILRRGWITPEVKIHNPLVFSGGSLVRISRVSMWGIRKIKTTDADVDELYNKIDALTESYFGSPPHEEQ